MTRVVYRLLCQVELNLKRSCRHFTVQWISINWWYYQCQKLGKVDKVSLIRSGGKGLEFYNHFCKKPESILPSWVTLLQCSEKKIPKAPSRTPVLIFQTFDSTNVLFAFADAGMQMQGYLPQKGACKICWTLNHYSSIQFVISLDCSAEHQAYRRIDESQR
jgi:hypothetical protein